MTPVRALESTSLVCAALTPTTPRRTVLLVESDFQTGTFPAPRDLQMAVSENEEARDPGMVAPCSSIFFYCIITEEQIRRQLSWSEVWNTLCFQSKSKTRQLKIPEKGPQVCFVCSKSSSKQKKEKPRRTQQKQEIKRSHKGHNVRENSTPLGINNDTGQGKEGRAFCFKQQCLLTQFTPSKLTLKS